MSRRSTKQRRAAERRREGRVFVRLDAEGMGEYWDPWGRRCGLGTWARWFESNGPERFLAKTNLPNGYMVSTVWLGTDLGGWFGKGDPLIYESMVFQGRSAASGERACRRYTTRRAAFAGHRELVAEWSARPHLEVVR